MYYDQLGHAGPEREEPIGPYDDVIEEAIQKHPDWSDAQIADDLDMTVWQVTDARFRAGT